MVKQTASANPACHAVEEDALNAARSHAAREPTWSPEPSADFAGISEPGAASRRLWLLALPVLGQSLLTLAVGWSDTLLAGHVLVEEKYLAWIPIQPPRPNKSGAWRLDFTAELLQGGLFNS